VVHRRALYVPHPQYPLLELLQFLRVNLSAQHMDRGWYNCEMMCAQHYECLVDVIMKKMTKLTVLLDYIDEYGGRNTCDSPPKP
jgi:hypothetical protein